ncbi:integrase [Klebsiella grimontii]|nr:integrase [Klebsiella grimontii]
MNSGNYHGRLIRKALILNFIALIAVVALSAIGIWLINQWVTA